jgi:hypothetical protein
MANAAARVLELFLETPNRGVTGVTHVTGRSVTPESQVVTTVTPVTYQERQSQENNATQPDASEQSSIRFEERAAIIEYDSGVPRTWAEALAQLDPFNPPADVPLARWQQFIDDCGHFLDLGWANRAEAFGWEPLELFGCDRERPLARYDHMGLLWIIQGRKLVALTARTATIDTLTGSLQIYRRVPIGTDRIVLAWELLSRNATLLPPHSANSL